jgi:chromosome segregation ATPase
MIKTRDFDSNERKYLKEIASLREKINQHEIRENNHIHQAQLAKATISELKANVSGLEQILCIKEDVNKQLDATTVKLANTIKDRESLNSQVQALLQSQNSSNSKILELEKEIVNLKNIVLDKDEYILSLKKLIIDIKEKQVQYIPKKVSEACFLMYRMIKLTTHWQISSMLPRTPGFCVLS